MRDSKSIVAWAPASVGNAIVGFDIMGFAVECLGDRVQATKIDPKSDARFPQVVIEAIEGVDGALLPTKAHLNSAGAAALKLLEDQRADFGLRLTIQKGIPLASGLGGSGASAVAGAMVANAFLKVPLCKEEVVPYALFGESVACGSAHGDNVVPSLLGGLRLIHPKGKNFELPLPEDLWTVLVHPKIKVETRVARQILQPHLSLSQYVAQTGHLAASLYALFKKDKALLKEFMKDELIEPQRAHLIDGFAEVQGRALDAGAICCSISGSGPTLFAWTDLPQSAEEIQRAMMTAFKDRQVDCRGWISKISGEGARIL